MEIFVKDICMLTLRTKIRLFILEANKGTQHVSQNFNTRPNMFNKACCILRGYIHLLISKHRFYIECIYIGEYSPKILS